VEDQKLKDEIQKKLEERGIIAVESVGILTSRDVLSAIDTIDELEASRNETEEWELIKKLQNERDKRLSEAKCN